MAVAQNIPTMTCFATTVDCRGAAPSVGSAHIYQALQPLERRRKKLDAMLDGLELRRPGTSRPGGKLIQVASDVSQAYSLRLHVKQFKQPG